MSGRPARWRTRGQVAALAAVGQMVAGSSPHAILIAGPPAVGKTTIALDLAAGLLCSAPNPADRPCRACRSCRLIENGDHPDLHRLAPEGPGGQVVIGDRDDLRKPRGIRHLLHDLAFLPIEGPARVAIIEGASQMNEDAQHALLKTLEEPPPGVTIILCADVEDSLLPTIRSRCARMRLRPTGPREIELLLGDLELADPPTAARLARMSGGRPGLAVAYARAPTAITIRAEIARTLLDLLAATRVDRLSTIRDLSTRCRDLAEALDGVIEARPSTRSPRSPEPTSPQEPEDSSEEASAPELDRRISPFERRRAARLHLEIWRDVARDLAFVTTSGDRAPLRDPALLEELVAAAAQLEPAAPVRFLERLARVEELVAGNANPELAIDVLALAWPRPRAVAA